MNLFLHLLIHFSFALLAGFVVWRIWREPISSFVGGIAGGFFVDFDHFFDYLLAFGFNFNSQYFSNGCYGLKSGKIFYFFHGWEYPIIFVIFALLLQKGARLRSIFLALALGMFFHLTADTFINEGMKPQGYSILYRAVNNFKIEKIVTPADYQKYLIRKSEVKF